MRLGCFGVLITGALLWGGGQETYVGLTNRSITEVTIEDLVKEKPEAKWLRISNGQLDFLGTVYSGKQTGGPAKELYIPIRVPNEEREGAPIHALYHTDDPADLAVFHRMQEIGDNPDIDETQLILKLVEMRDELNPVRTVEGMVEFGIESDKGDGKAREMFDNLAPGAIMLEGGNQPNLWVGLGMLGAGLLLGLFSLGGLAKSKS